MRYIVAGYVFVLGLLFLYAVQLVWRRHRLTRLVARVADAAGTDAADATASVPDPAVVTAPIMAEREL